MLDGDETFGNFELSNNDSFFGIFNLKLAMPRLSGPDICNITKDFGLLLNGLAVWIYGLNGVIFTEKGKHSEL